MLSHFSHVQLCETVVGQAPLSVGFSRQENWSGLLSPPPGDLPNPGTEPASLSLLHWQVGSLPLAPPVSTHLTRYLGGVLEVEQDLVMVALSDDV